MTAAQTPVTEGGGEVTADPRQMRRILTSSFLGSMIEFYDFMLFATAATVVFGKVFFPGASPAMATVSSFITLTLGHFMRPLGAILFGHFGDRLGRKKVLVTSILMMGAATVGIGLLPGTASIGMSAVVLLVVLRIVQGLAVGGEWGGAMLIALEQAPGGKRGFAASFATMGGPAGTLLATLSISAASMLPDHQFFSWGWRIPFLATIVLVGLALYIRLQVEESPLFRTFQRASRKREVPIADVLRNSRKPLALAIVMATAMFSVQGIATVWGINAAIAHGASRTGVLNVKALSALILVFVTVLFARLSDRVGRRRVMLAGLAGLTLAAYPAVQLISSGSVALLFTGVLLAQLSQGAVLGPISAFIAELFPTRTRYTASSTAYQTGSSLGGGVSPLVAASLVAGTGWVGSVGIVWAAVVGLALLVLLLTPRGVGERQDLTAIE